MAALRANGDDSVLSIIYIRRDARDAVNSGLRKGVERKLNGKSAMRREIAGMADGVRWWLTDAYVQRVIEPSAHNFMSVDYEELMRSPDATISDLAKKVLLDVKISDGTAIIPAQHVIWSNQRSANGPVIRFRKPDQRREMLSPPLRWFLTALNRSR